MSIFVNVVNQKMSITSTFDNIVSGTQEFVKFKFNLSEDWDGLMPFAQFAQNGTAYNQYLDIDNCVTLPAEIGAGTCTMMLYGSVGTKRATTNYITLKIDKNILVEDAESTEITQSLYGQLMSKIDRIYENSIFAKDHNQLTNRNAENQHPINAITGLQDALVEKGNGDETYSIGENNIAGIMGYAITRVNTNSTSIMSITVQADTVEYDIDDIVSIVKIKTNCYNCAKIAGIGQVISGEITITLKDFDTESLEPWAKENIVNLAADEDGTSRLFVITKPSVGNVTCGDNILVVGKENVGAQDDCSVNGHQNVAGTYSHASGRKNFVGYAGEVSGRENNARGMYTLTSGYKNKNDGYASVVGGTSNKITSGAHGSSVFGSSNKTSHSATFVAGEGNETTTKNQTIVGNYAKLAENDEDTLFAVGNGTKTWNPVTGQYDIVKSTAMKVTKDGKLHADLAQSEFALIETITLGTEIYGVAPSDWETNWGAYYYKQSNADFSEGHSLASCPYEHCHPWGSAPLWQEDIDIYNAVNLSRTYERRKTKDNVRYDFDMLLLKIVAPKASSDEACSGYVYFINEPNDWADSKMLGYMSGYASTSGKRYSSIFIENKRGLVFSEFVTNGQYGYECMNKKSSYLGMGNYSGRIHGWQIANIDSEKPLVRGTEIKVYGCKY